MAYKAVNTLDSMIGYRNERYLYFGRFAAHLDDVLNFVPARLTGLFMILAAYVLRLDGTRAIRVVRRDTFGAVGGNSRNFSSGDFCFRRMKSKPCNEYEGSTAAFNPALKNLKKPTRLYLMRHGQAKGFDESRIYGHNDVELADEGIAQFQRLGRRLKEEQITALYCSDLKRSYVGAHIIAQYLELVTQPPFPELREKSLAALEGLNLQEIQERFPAENEKLMNDWIGYSPPGAESLKDLEQRVIPTLKRILQRHEGKRIALVGHGGVNRIILLDAIGMALKNFFCFEQDYGCLNIIDYYPDGAVIRLLNGL
jgi:alpha-ribazole phosphatase